jgi:hypothetical protein
MNKMVWRGSFVLQRVSVAADVENTLSIQIRPVDAESGWGSGIIGTLKNTKCQTISTTLMGGVSHHRQMVWTDCTMNNELKLLREGKIEEHLFVTDSGTKLYKVKLNE